MLKIPHRIPVGVCDTHIHIKRKHFISLDGISKWYEKKTIYVFIVLDTFERKVSISFNQMISTD